MFSSASQTVRQAVVSQRCSHVRSHDRRELLWALASFVVLILCWDVACRLDERAFVPRVRIAHVLGEQGAARPGITHPVTEFE